MVWRLVRCGESHVTINWCQYQKSFYRIHFSSINSNNHQVRSWMYTMKTLCQRHRNLWTSSPLCPTNGYKGGEITKLTRYTGWDRYPSLLWANSYRNTETYTEVNLQIVYMFHVDYSNFCVLQLANRLVKCLLHDTRERMSVVLPHVTKVLACL